MRKKALIGFAALIMLLLFCFFFSGTIKTMTTPKVMITQPKQGRLKEEIAINGYLTFSKTTNIAFSDIPEGATPMITKINVAPGLYVQEGDVLFEMQFIGIESMIDVQEKIYDDAQVELIELENSNNELQLHRNDQQWLVAYDALIQAYDTRHTAQIALEVKAQIQEVKMISGRLPEGITSETLLALQAAVDSAEQNVQAALNRMSKANRFKIADEAYQYTMKRRKLEDQMYHASQQITALQTLEQSCRQIHATQSGYITEVNITVGEKWDGRTTAITMSTSDSAILLRADSSNVGRAIPIGASVNVSGYHDSSVKTYVIDTGYDMRGNSYIDVILQKTDVALLGSTYSLIKKGVNMQINYTAANYTYLLPASAIRGNAEQSYIYTLKEVDNNWGQIALIVENQPITILDESGDTVAVTGVSDSQKIAYMEDRAISPGMEVMSYD